MGILPKWKPFFGRLTIGKENNGNIWKCTECPYSDTRQAEIRGHITYVRNKTKSKDAHCPYCNKKENDMGKLKRHIIIKKCKNTEQDWIRNMARHSK